MNIRSSEEAAKLNLILTYLSQTDGSYAFDYFLSKKPQLNASDHEIEILLDKLISARLIKKTDWEDYYILPAGRDILSNGGITQLYETQLQQTLATQQRESLETTNLKLSIRSQQYNLRTRWISIASAIIALLSLIVAITRK
jgi:hypothetical protein